MVKLVYLNQEFYQRTLQLKEAAIKEDRPYAVVLVKHNDLWFAIPFRSNISHEHCFVTDDSSLKYKKGLDFTKALLISYKDISHTPPKISTQEFNKIKSQMNKITTYFELYVDLYIQTLNRQKKNKLNTHELSILKFSTLQNYHKELGIKSEIKRNNDFSR